MIAIVTEATMSDGMPFPFAPLLDVKLEDGREMHDLTPSQLQQLAERENLQLQSTNS